MERLKLSGLQTSETQFDLIGVDSLHGQLLSSRASEPYEVRIRVAGRTDSLAEAIPIGNEVETLYTNGPAGGGGVFKSAKDTVAIESTLMSEAFVTPHIQYVETGHEAAPNRSFADWRQRQHIQHLGDRL